jgi:hypothetical protein
VGETPLLTGFKSTGIALFKALSKASEIVHDLEIEENIVEVDWHKRPKTRNAILGGLTVNASPLVSKLKSKIPLLSLPLNWIAQILVDPGNGNIQETLT